MSFVLILWWYYKVVEFQYFFDFLGQRLFEKYIFEKKIKLIILQLSKARILTGSHNTHEVENADMNISNYSHLKESNDAQSNQFRQGFRHFCS